MFTFPQKVLFTSLKIRRLLEALYKLYNAIRIFQWQRYYLRPADTIIDNAQAKLLEISN